MSEEKKSVAELLKTYGIPAATFFGGYLLGKFAPELKNRISRIRNASGENFYTQAHDFLQDFKKHVRENPEYSKLSSVIDLAESLLADKKYREQNK